MLLYLFPSLWPPSPAHTAVSVCICTLARRPGKLCAFCVFLAQNRLVGGTQQVLQAAGALLAQKRGARCRWFHVHGQFHSWNKKRLLQLRKPESVPNSKAHATGKRPMRSMCNVARTRQSLGFEVHLVSHCFNCFAVVIHIPFSACEYK